MLSNNSIFPGALTFESSIRVQLRVIHALFIRELLTRYGRNNIGFLWLIVEPMLFTLAVTVIWTATRTVHGSDLPIVEFSITGYSAMMMWRNMPGRCIGAIHSNKSLLFHRQVRPLDVYTARVILEFAGSTVAFCLLIAAFWAADWARLPEDSMKILGGWLLLGWFGFGIAVLLGVLSERFEIVEKIWSPFSYLLFPFSGAAFIADSLPQNVREVLLYLPMLNCTEYIREGYFGSQIHAHYDMVYVSIFNLVLTLAALSLVRRMTIDTDYS
jgi:ABC-type polysaccharide/polyol phosphate export permease